MRLVNILSIAVGLTLASISGAWAQGQYPTVNGPFIPATVMHCLNAQGLAVPATAAGTCVGSSGGGASSNFGAAFPAAGTAIGCTDGTNMVACGTATNPFRVNPTGTTAQPISAAASSIAAGAGVDGWDLTQGTKGDAACANPATSCSIIQLLKGQWTDIRGAIPTQAGTVIIGGVGIDQTTIGTTNAMSLKYVNATALGTPTNFGTTPGAVVALSANASHFLGTVAASAGSGNVGTGTQRVVLATDQAALTNSLPVINGASAYETVAASQTAQSLGATGATGDYLSHCVVTPGTTSPGVVTILDNATAVVSFAGGASSVSNLVPFPVPIGALSVSGAWKITTGSNVTVVCVGKFT